MNISERENVFFKKVKDAKNSNQHTYIYGIGAGALIVIEGLKKFGLWDYVTGFVCDFVNPECGNFNNKPIFEINKIKEQENTPLIILSIRGFDEKRKQEILEWCDLLDEDIMSLWSVNGELMNYDFYLANKNKFDNAYDRMADEKSKLVFEAFINSRISGKKEYLADIWELPQYYDSDIVDFGRISVFVDCGAYDGDSYLAFTEEYKKNMSKQYEGKAYLFEPDKDNYKKMVQNCTGDICCCNIGIFSKKDVLVFMDGDTTSSVISEEGNISIEVDSIDNVVKENHVDFIKMDIEGSELDGIIGSTETIKRSHPILAICVYHKREDIYTIMDAITSLDCSYKFYLRTYKPWSQELVLYAV